MIRPRRSLCSQEAYAIAKRPLSAVRAATRLGPRTTHPCAVVTNLPAATAVDYVRTAGRIVGGTAAAPRAPSRNSSFVILHEGRGQTTATGYAYVESADLLLPDGWAYLGLTVPPEQLDEVASKQREPAKWHRWKQSGSDILIQNGSSQWTKLEADRVRPLPAGASLQINLIHRNSTRFGGMGSYNTSATITFSQNGRFARSSGVIAGTGAVQAGGGFGGKRELLPGSAWKRQRIRRQQRPGHHDNHLAWPRQHEPGRRVQGVRLHLGARWRRRRRATRARVLSVHRQQECVHRRRHVRFGRFQITVCVTPFDVIVPSA